MPTRDEFVRYVTDFLAARKTLAGIDVPIQWAPGRQSDQITAKIPLQIDGVQYGEKLMVSYLPSRPGFALNVVCADLCVSRLDFSSHGPHVNGFGGLSIGLPARVGENHIHRWAQNIRFVDGAGAPLELKHAEDIPTAMRNFDDVLRFFCDEMNVDLPHGHYIELPRMLL